MTEQRMRELLHEVADVVPPPNAADQAWRRSVRVRRRRTVGTVLAVAASIVAVVGLVSFATDGTAPGPDPVHQSAPVAVARVPEAAMARPADARIDGGSAWVGPTVAEDARLPHATSVLPGSIDLAGDFETTTQPGRAVAAFAASDSEHLMPAVLVVDHGGRVSRLDVSDLDLDLVTKPDDGYVLPLNISSLSPDGRQLVFAQNDAVVLYNLVTGHHVEWSNGDADSYYVGWTETTDGLRIQVVDDLMNPDTGKITYTSTDDGESDESDGVALWPARTEWGSKAQSVLDRPVPALGPGLGDPVLITITGETQALLALPVEGDDRLRPRSRVVGWLGPDAVAFQSQDYGTFHVLGWNTDSGAVQRLTDVALPSDWDAGVIASWADLPPA
ncbi:MAG TPA: hypothetical protein VEX15_14575 [Nocardioidaceae bacterium]|nr:hypothetical protein [Nocardioidaceae bacterium]